MTITATINPGDRVELSIPAWLAKEKGFASREVAGEVLRVTGKALQVRAHVMVRECEFCQNCGRAIDNPASRLLGFGPICSDNLGLPHAETYASLSPAEREAIRNRIAVATTQECWFPLSQAKVKAHEPAPAPDQPATTEETPEQYRARWGRVDAYLNDPDRVAQMRAGWENAKPVDAPPQNPRRVLWDAVAYRVLFPYAAEVVTAIKRIPGARFTSEPEKYWTVPEGSGADLLRFAAEHGFEVDGAAAAQAEAARLAAERNLAESRAAEAEFYVDGLGGTLRPFQAVGVGYMVRVRRGIIGDEMRLGKTPQSLAVMLATDAFPALLVVPATLKPAWKREVEKWLPGRSVVVLEGEAPTRAERYGPWMRECMRLLTTHDVSIINWDILVAWAGAVWKTDAARNRRKLVACEGPLSRAFFRALVCDEYHNHILSHRSQRSMVLDYLAARMRERCAEERFDAVQLLLSGTPYKKSAADYLHPLQVVGRLDDVGGWRGWATEFCGYAGGIMGALPVPVAALEAANQRLRSVCMVRRRRSDVFAEIPKVERHVVPFAIDNRTEYDRAERDVVRWVAQQAVSDVEFTASLDGLSVEERKRAQAKRFAEAAKIAARAEGLVKIAALKRLAARGKMAAAAEWIANFMEESGEKLIVGGWHQDVVEEIAARFNNAPFIHGGVSGGRKDDAVQRFQRCVRCKRPHELHYNPADSRGVCSEYEPDMSVPLISINFKSGGMGLTLTAANDTVVFEPSSMPDDMDQLEARVGHIDKMAPANHWYLIAEGTIEEDVLAVLERRRKEAAAGADGGGWDEESEVMAELLDRMAARAAAT